MSATLYDIADRWKFHPLAIVTPSDFTLANPRPVDLATIANDPGYSLYCLDLGNASAVWVHTGPEVDVSKGSFFYSGQFQQADGVAITSIEELEEIVAGIDLAASKLTVIHSVGRCGSTLINRVYASQPQLFSLSEPDTFTQICLALGSNRISTGQAIRLLTSCLKAAIRPLPGNSRRDNVAIKLRSQCITLASHIVAAAPHTRNIYITRDPASWIRSAYRAFVPPEKAEDREFQQIFEDSFASFIPIVEQERSPDGPMCLAKVWMLNWIHNTLSYRDVLAKGIPFLTLDYADLKRDPRTAIESIFRFSGVYDTHWPAVDATLTQDSQSDSPLARETVKDNVIPADKFDTAMATLKRYLPEYA